jgi:hypothetical protein
MRLVLDPSRERNKALRMNVGGAFRPGIKQRINGFSTVNQRKSKRPELLGN